MTTNGTVGIVGGGPGGLMLARLLEHRGFDVVVFERDTHPDQRPQGGSLDLHAETGQRAMRLAGLGDEFAAAARPEEEGDRLYDQDGKLLFDRDGAGDDRPEIDRAVLRRILLDSLRPGTVRWNSKIEEISLDDDGPTVGMDGATRRFDLVVGADGAWSRVRPLLTTAQPAYEGVAMLEMGFDARAHPEVDALVGNGKMFAVGENRLLIGQRNGNAHIRGYAGWRMSEVKARRWTAMPVADARAHALASFAGWESRLTNMIAGGDVMGVRPLYALPIGLKWPSTPGVTLIGDAAHVMSPFSGEGVNLALADATDLAEALISGGGKAAVAAAEARISDRAAEAARGAAEGLATVFTPDGPAPVLDHYRERVATEGVVA